MELALSIAVSVTLCAFWTGLGYLFGRRKGRRLADKWMAMWLKERGENLSKPSFGLGFEDDTEDDAEVTATPKGEYL